MKENLCTFNLVLSLKFVNTNLKKIVHHFSLYKMHKLQNTHHSDSFESKMQLELIDKELKFFVQT